MFEGGNNVNMREPDVLRSKYVTMKEDGTYAIAANAPPSVLAQFEEYLKIITVDGFVEAEPLPDIPPLNK